MPTAVPVFYSGESVRKATMSAHTEAVECVIETMHAHLQEVLSLEDLASVACLSPAHFNRVFRRVVGIPPVEYLTALRFQRARQLLLLTSLKITDICFEVGYTSTGSFTSRFTQLVGLSPRQLRLRAHAFEPCAGAGAVGGTGRSLESVSLPGRQQVRGRIIASTPFRGTIYVGLFRTPIPQGRPLRCTRLLAPGPYVLPDIADGLYYLRAAAFPLASDPLASLLPGEKQLLGNNLGPLIVHQGKVFGDPNLVLHPPRLSDPPLVMGLPLLL